MNTKDYRALLDSLDLYYQYTDDYKVFKAASNKWDRARRLAKDNEELNELYKQFIKKVW